MLGVVLCGGLSSRMRSDKGLLQDDGKNWAQKAKEKLHALHLEVRFSINSTQLPVYSKLFSSDSLIVDAAEVDIKGPLLGVLSVHLQFPKSPLFVLACDMPLMHTDIIKELLAAYNSKPGYGAYVYTNNNEPEPLCAIYAAPALEFIWSLYNNNSLRRHSMKYVIDQVDCVRLPVVESQKDFFKNFNAHADLNGL